MYQNLFSASQCSRMPTIARCWNHSGYNDMVSMLSIWVQKVILKVSSIGFVFNGFHSEHLFE